MARLRFDIRLLCWAVGVAATAVGLAWPHLGGALSYPEFVLGLHSWEMVNKQRDFWAFRLFVLVAITSFVVLALWTDWLNQRQKLLPGAVQQLLELSLFPLVIWLGVLLGGGHDPVPIGWVVAVFGGLLLLFAFSLSSSHAQDVYDRALLPRLIAAMAFSFFSGLGAALCFSQMAPELARSARLVMAALVLGPPVLVCLLGCGAIVRCGSRRDVLRWVDRLLMLAQAGLPLLFFSLLPPRQLEGGMLLAYPWSWRMPVLLVGFALWAWWGGVRVWTRWGKQNADGMTAAPLSFWSLVALAVFLTAGQPTGAAVWGDDFHLGEMLLPWQQWIDFGKVPFVDVVPFHGFMHFVAGALGHFFYGEGVMAGQYHIRKLMYAVPIGLTVAGVYRLAGSKVALLVALFSLPISFYMGRLLWLAPLLFWLALPGGWQRPARWLTQWICACALAVGYNLVAGAALGVATLPFALWQAFRLWRDQRGLFLRFAGAVTALLLLVLALPLPRSVLVGYIRFVVENQAAYTVVRSIPWSMSWSLTPASSGLTGHVLVYELLRMLWIPVLVAIVLLVLCAGGAKSGRRPRAAWLFPGVSMALVLLMLSPYALSRIDAGSISRTGSIAFWSASLFLPVALAWYVGRIQLRHLLVLAFVLSLYSESLGFADRFNPRYLFWRAYRDIHVPAEAVYVHPGSTSLAHLDHTVVAQDQRTSWEAFQAALATVLPDGETYYDLTNRQLYYVLTQSEVPARYAAEASAVNGMHQESILRQLTARPPAAVYVAPIWPNDHTSNLRSYHLYRHVLLGYQLVQRGEHLFMVSPRSPAFSDRLPEADAVARLNALFAYSDLKQLPAAWGMSWMRLQGHAEAVGASTWTADAAAEDQRMYRIDLPEALRRGADADLLMLEVEAPAGYAGRGSLRWMEEWGGITQPPGFDVVADRLVLPVGAFPGWLCATNLYDVELTLPGTMDLKSVSWWRRTDGAI
jgi:hypothetical protein